MLPRANRLKIPTTWSRENPDFQLKTEFFKVLVKRKPETSSVKIGFIISGKVGKAIVRNRVRRRLASEFHRRLVELASDQELVLIAYPNIARASNEEISASLNKVLSKLHF